MSVLPYKGFLSCGAQHISIYPCAIAPSSMVNSTALRISRRLKLYLLSSTIGIMVAFKGLGFPRWETLPELWDDFLIAVAGHPASLSVSNQASIMVT